MTGREQGTKWRKIERPTLPRDGGEHMVTVDEDNLNYITYLRGERSGKIYKMVAPWSGGTVWFVEDK